jgi:3-deoxy-manno-octulosonate cytidylyltransferase (CMP-KDO synthetase)
MKDYLIVIPVRMSGTRLPGKPLIKINGIPMVQRVYEKCAQVTKAENIIVATEDQEIVDFCLNNEISVLNTGPAISALDRVKLVSDVVLAQFYINVQGDEPLVNVDDIKTIIAKTVEIKKGVIIGKTNCNELEFHDYSKAKVVCDLNGKLLYSSRSGIPITPKGQFESAERAIWIYGLRKGDLDSYFSNAKNTRLDKIEDNEIIRFLELNIDVYCVDVIGNSWAVDEIKDIKIVEEILNNDRDSDN